MKRANILKNCKTKPYDHQLKELIDHGQDKNRAIFWEMGVGKSKLIIDNAFMLYEENKINCLIVIAPNIVHSNWTLRELPTHSWKETTTAFFTWDSGKAKSAKFAKAFKNVFEYPYFKIFAFNYEAFRSDSAEKRILQILETHDCMLVCDESTRIKNPTAIISKKLLKYGRYAKYKRILTGTPYTTGPFDIYSQFRFMNSSILGFSTYTEFKTNYGIFTTECARIKGKLVKYQELQDYRNLDDLKQRVDACATRITKAEALDLPDCAYVHYQIDMQKKQRLLYNQLKEELIVLIEHEGKLSELVTPNVLSLLMRLQQIAGGFVPHDGKVIAISADNPRIQLSKELIKDVIDSDNQIVVWARFQAEIDALVAMCDKQKFPLVEFHGRINTAGKNEAIDLFQNGTARVLIGNQASGGMGITLTKGSYMLYYSNSFSLDQRLQSQARIHRIGQLKKCTYIDISMRDSVDIHVRARLIENFDLANQLTGDEVMEWIS